MSDGFGELTRQLRAHGVTPYLPPHALKPLLVAAADAIDEQTRALAELVRLKDGPRDDAYRAAKDAAWDRARALSGSVVSQEQENP